MADKNAEFLTVLNSIWQTKENPPKELTKSKYSLFDVFVKVVSIGFRNIKDFNLVAKELQIDLGKTTGIVLKTRYEQYILPIEAELIARFPVQNICPAPVPAFIPLEKVNTVVHIADIENRVEVQEEIVDQQQEDTCISPLVSKEQDTNHPVENININFQNQAESNVAVSQQKLILTPQPKQLSKVQTPRKPFQNTTYQAVQLNRSTKVSSPLRQPALNNQLKQKQISEQQTTQLKEILKYMFEQQLKIVNNSNVGHQQVPELAVEIKTQTKQVFNLLYNLFAEAYNSQNCSLAMQPLALEFYQSKIDKLRVDYEQQIRMMKAESEELLQKSYMYTENSLSLLKESQMADQTVSVLAGEVQNLSNQLMVKSTADSEAVDKIQLRYVKNLKIAAAIDLYVPKLVSEMQNMTKLVIEPKLRALDDQISQILRKSKLIKRSQVLKLNLQNRSAKESHSQILTLEAKINAQQLQLQDLARQNRQLRANATYNQSLLLNKSLDNTISARQEVENLVNEIADLQDQLTGAHEQMAQYQKDNVEIIDQLEELQSLRDENAAMSKEFSEFQKQTASIKAAYRAQLAELQKQLAPHFINQEFFVDK